jgi:eukaryotic-like serine/threonine-protein kinase
VRKLDTTTIALVTCAVLVWGTAAFFAMRGPSPDKKDPPPAAPSSSATATATATATTADSAPPPPPVDPSTCVAGLFPDGTFKRKPADFAFVCEEVDPLRGGTLVRSVLIRATENASSEATREWVGTGWYMMAAWTLLRARCCPTAPEPRFSFDLVCPAAPELQALEKAMRANDKAAVASALDGYTKQMRCLSKFGQAENFGMSSPPGADIDALKKMLRRAGLADKK